MYIEYQVLVSKFDESEFQEKQNSYMYIKKIELEKMYAASIVLFTNRDTFKYYYIIFDLN